MQEAPDEPENEQIRRPFSRQPARCLVIDLTGDVCPEVVASISEGLTNFFSLVCNLKSGSCRIPYFCLLSMSPYTEVCFVMQRLTKLSYSKIEKAVKDMFSSCDRKVSNSNSKYYEHAFRDAISQFQKIKLTNASAKLSVTILTCQDPKVCQVNIAQALKKIYTSKLDVVEICCFRQNNDESDSSVLSQKFEDYEIMNKISINVIEREELCVESVLHKWLRDTNADHEDLHLLFPKNSFKIKCDIEEKLIDLSELPRQNNMHISVHGFNNLSDMTMPRSIFRSSEGVSIIHLQVLYRIGIDTVCESIVFGRPYILSSSNCWRINWEDLEANRNRFAALCHSLFISEQCLLCENITNTITKSDTLVKGVKPKGLYIIFPAQKGSGLLIKSIASRGLTMLNKIEESAEVELSSDALQEVNSELMGIPAMSSYNPLVHETGLISSLKQALNSSGNHSRNDYTPGTNFDYSAGCEEKSTPSTFTDHQISRNPSFVHPRSSYKLDGSASSPKRRLLKTPIRTPVAGTPQNNPYFSFTKKKVKFSNDSKLNG